MGKTLILDSKQINQKLERMAHEVHEVCFNEEEIIICGIEGNGTIIADFLVKKLQEISPIKPISCKIVINKSDPINNESHLNIKASDYKNKSIILIDDVSNSGKTLIYAIRHFLAEPIKNIKTFVLVDRNHNRYPVNADFTGLSISTTLKEHIEVELNRGENNGVYLL